MAHECIRPEQAGAVVDLAPEDARLIAAEACPNCRMILRSYGDFLRGDTVPGARPQEASAALALFLRSRIEASPPRPRRIVSPARIALLAVAVVVAAIGIRQWLPPSTPLPRLERGTQAPGFAAPTITRSDGEIQLRWNEVADADAYVVVLRAQDLTEVTRLEVTGDVWTIRDQLLDTLMPSGLCVWQVWALRGGLELSRSDMAFLERQSP